MRFGPADLLLVQFPSAAVPEQMTAMLRDTALAGVITLLDVALIRPSGDGGNEVIELDGFSDDLSMAGVRLSAGGLIGEDDIDALTQDIAPGCSALVVLFEHTWTRRVGQAVQDSGGTVIATQRFPAEVVNEVAELAELMERRT